MIRPLTTASVLALVGCGAPAGRAPETGAEPPSPETRRDDPADQRSEEIRETVFTAQRAGFLHHDVDAYLEAWADDGRLVIGRGPEPSEHDTTWDRERLEASRHMRFAAEPPDDRQMEHADVEVRLEGDGRAELRCRTTTRTGRMVEVVDEIYRLQRTEDGWRIVENRAWPVRVGTPDDMVEYDAEAYRDADRAVADALDRGPPAAAARVMMAAWRFEEAYDVARRAVEEDPTPDALDVLARLATLLGEREVAVDAYRRLHEASPDAGLPEWAHEAIAE